MSVPFHTSRWTASVLLLAAVAWTGGVATAQQTAAKYVDHTYRDDSGEHRYVVFVPAGYRADKPSPAILFLHGAGERGKDNRLPLTIGLAPFVQARWKTFPFLVVYPQCESTDGRILQSWNADEPDGKRALAILDDARKQYNFDSKRVVLTGWSMGGYGAWSLGMADPSRWSAIVPLSGAGDPAQIEKLKDVPVWAFHGVNDTLVKAEDGKKLAEALKGAGGAATYTELPEGGHDINREVYGNDAVITWMLDPQKTTPALGASTVNPLEVVKVPFVPAVEISNAVGVRLGNEVLDALSYSIPQTVSPSLLQGGLNDMFDSTVASGRQFSIRFAGISYYGQLERVAAKAIGRDRILVQLGIRNITLTIGGTSVTGARHSAQAGPIAIRIGHAYPVWFNLELTPYVADRRIRLRLVGAGFNIPDNNWSVSQPAGVSVSGFGMTQEAVVSGLTSGLYGAKGRIQNEVVAIAPRIIGEIEKTLTIPDAGSSSASGSTLAKLWPLPVYPPRFQAWPEHISTDENGLSLVMGMTVASTDPFGPAKQIKRTTETSISMSKVPTDKGLHFVIAPEIIAPITDMLVDHNQNQLDLNDIPEPLFGKLADRATLREIIPDLAKYGDELKVRSSVRVVRPITVKESTKSDTNDKQKPMELELPAVQVVVSIKKDAQQDKWQPCAVFDLNLSEQLRASLQKPAHDLRVVNLDWLQVANVTGTGKFAEGYEAKDSTLKTDQYVDQFKTAWAAYFNNMKAISAEVPDLNVGMSKLRMADVRYESSVIDLAYFLARIKISNQSQEPFTYQTKAPTSAWGSPLTLKPGDSHEFEIPYPLTYQRKTATGMEVYTLPVGSHSEYRVPATGGAARLFAAKRP